MNVNWDRWRELTDEQQATVLKVFEVKPRLDDPDEWLELVSRRDYRANKTMMNAALDVLGPALFPELPRHAQMVIFYLKEQMTFDELADDPRAIHLLDHSIGIEPVGTDEQKADAVLNRHAARRQVAVRMVDAVRRFERQVKFTDRHDQTARIARIWYRMMWRGPIRRSLEAAE